MKEILFALMLFCAESAFAAQMAKVTALTSPVYALSDDTSRVIDYFSRDQVIVVSNIADHGYYKVRTSAGAYGWISGSQIILASEGVPVDTPFRNRVILMYGLTSLSYGDPLTKFNLTSSDLNFGTSVSLEYQYQINGPLNLAFRIEYLNSKSSEVLIGANVTQKVRASLLPIEMGVLYNVFRNSKTRFGLGAYAGIAASSAMIVSQTNVGEVTYGSHDPCGEVLGQVGIDLSRTFALDAEAGYRIQMPTDASATNSFGSAFNINYSGIFFRGGLEAKF